MHASISVSLHRANTISDIHALLQLSLRVLMSTRLFDIARIFRIAGSAAGAAGSGGGRGGSSAASVTARGPALASMFQYQRARRSFDRDIDRPSLSPVGSTSARLLASPRKAKRKIPKVPFKVLDAPALQDDFYLNLVDWSSQNILAVGLGSCVYLWSACTSKVTKVGYSYLAVEPLNAVCCLAS